MDQLIANLLGLTIQGVCLFQVVESLSDMVLTKAQPPDTLEQGWILQVSVEGLLQHLDGLVCPIYLAVELLYAFVDILVAVVKQFFKVNNLLLRYIQLPIDRDKQLKHCLSVIHSIVQRFFESHDG